MNYDNVLQSLDIVALDPTLGVNHDDICAAGALAIRQLRAERDALAALLNEAQGFVVPDTAWDYTTDAGGYLYDRIAVALFGDQNNRTDEECVARSAEIGYQLTGTQQALFQAQEAVKMLASEVAALRDQEKFNETALKGYRNNIDDLKHDIARHIQITADQAQEMEKLRQDLAATRALLREVREWIPYYRWIPDLRQRVDAAIVDKAP